MSHTPTPWSYFYNEKGDHTIQSDGIEPEDWKFIAAVTESENAERIVACVNKFAAFTTDQINEGIDISKLSRERDELLAALEEISEGKGRYNQDQFEHAKNTIEDMKQIALEAIQKVKGETHER